MSNGKRSKRANREGAVWQEKSTGKYRWRWKYTDPLTGKTRVKNLSASTQTELNQAIKEFRQSLEQDKGNYSYLTISEYLAKWLETKKVMRKAKTHENYNGICCKHIIPTLGEYRLRMLRKKHVQDLLNEKAKTLSPSTVASIKRVFHIAMNDALDEGIIEKNPVNRTAIPTVPKKQPVALEQDDMLLLFKLAYTGEFLPPNSHVASREYFRKQYYVALCLSMATGVRKGELFALSWDKIKGNMIIIDKNVEYIKGRRILTTPKTQGSIRNIMIPRAMTVLLMIWKDYQSKFAEKFDGYYNNENDLVFTDTVGGIVSYSNMYKRWWNPLRHAAGVPWLKWHNLRSAALSYFAAHGADMQVVRQLAGHSDLRTTLDYYIGLVSEQEKKRLAIAENWAQTVLPAISIPATTDS